MEEAHSSQWGGEERGAFYKEVKHQLKPGCLHEAGEGRSDVRKRKPCEREVGLSEEK